jgi:phosphatidate phosphatase APP1
MRPFLPPPVRIQPYFGYRNCDRLIISARALRLSAKGFDKRGRLRTVRTMLSHFASREERGIAVELEIEAGGHVVARHRSETDREGFVHFDVALDPALDLPPHTAWETVSMRWSNRLGPQRVEARVLVPGMGDRLAVISDIDDTVIETGVTGGLRSVIRNWRRLIAQLPDERVAVPGADAFYGALAGGQPAFTVDAPPPKMPATHRPFFYVSSSPWNLFSYLVAFLCVKGLPLGPMMLRDWGFNRATLGSSGHGAHKSAAIASIMALYPELKFALIGDDTQGDLPAYAEAAERAPDQVAAIFIRTTAADRFSPQQRAAKIAIEKAGIPLWLGDTFAVGKEFLDAIGVAPGGETEQIVLAVEKLPTAADREAMEG